MLLGGFSTQGAQSSVALNRPDIVIEDFEGTNFGDWKMSGEAFGTGSAHGALPNQMTIDGFLGSCFASS